MQFVCNPFDFPLSKGIPGKRESLIYLAERVGFEPTEGVKPSAVFKTAALNHSTTSPLRITVILYTVS